MRIRQKQIKKAHHIKEKKIKLAAKAKTRPTVTSS
jgi:hypothetical protein